MISLWGMKSKNRDADRLMGKSHTHTHTILDVFLKDPYFMSVVQKRMVDVEMLGV